MRLSMTTSIRRIVATLGTRTRLFAQRPEPVRIPVLKPRRLR